MHSLPLHPLPPLQFKDPSGIRNKGLFSAPPPSWYGFSGSPYLQRVRRRSRKNPMAIGVFSFLPKSKKGRGPAEKSLFFGHVGWYWVKGE